MRDVAQRLVTWFEANARQLPWRSEPRDPYRVLVSELMLQQTQVDRVVPRFEDFVDRFPTLQALAGAPEEEVLAVWSGLGYYRRARLLHALAREVTAAGGRLPEDAVELQRLPGIGPYTAAAVASLAFGQSVPVLDGNVLRVAARFLAYAEDPRTARAARTLLGWVKGLMGHQEPRRVNEALMELGALVCTPRSPGCESCAIRSGCRAAAEGMAEELPAPRRQRAVEELRWVAACCSDSAGRWLLRQVDEGPILRGLWLPPITELAEVGDEIAVARSLLPVQDQVHGRIVQSVRHSITHRRITIIPVLFSLPDVVAPKNNWRLADPRGPALATSSLLAKLVHAAG